MSFRDIFDQTSPNQAPLQDGTNTTNNFITGISSNYRSYTPSTAKYASVATTRASVVDPQRGFANFYGSGRYSSREHWYANSSSIADSGNRISYLAPAGSRPNVYHWGQQFDYTDPIKAALSNQASYGLNFYRLSDGNKVVLDQQMTDNRHWIYYNQANVDNNLSTLSSAGAISKIENTTGSHYLDNTTNPSTPLLFQTHGGMGANNNAVMVTDYPRDSFMQASDRDSYVIYQLNFGSNAQIPTNVELEGEWMSNSTGGRSGSKKKK